jgi:acyl-coenzyme A synthetase/AMP-(fatty) acid ligase
VSQPDRGCSPTVREGSANNSSEGLANELEAFVKSHLAVYKYPRWIEFVDFLPKTIAAKSIAGN